MNRSGVALAADSATTVSYWDPDSGERRVRFFKGANKIFNLSVAHPVGLMTYNSANLQGIPWEVLVKAYRDDRGVASQDTLAEYPPDFFSYLLENTDLYPAAFQKERLQLGIIETATQAAVAILSRAQKNKIEKDNLQAYVDEQFNRINSEVDTLKLLSDNSSDLIEKVKENDIEEIKNKFKDVKAYNLVNSHFDLEAIIKFGIRGFFSEGLSPLQHSGLVFSGYGHQEYFPKLEMFECFGVVEDTVICRRSDGDCYRVSHDSVSEIVPIAQSEMVNTFMFGASMDVLMQMDQSYEQAVDELLGALASDGRLDLSMVTVEEKLQSLDSFKQALRDYIWKEHYDPLRRVIGMMPMDELADLAETFVSIESLKERVTKPSESVSGPVDVAVITKGDGFIWIKRKHYFDPNLNLRFVAQKNKQIGEG